MADHVVRPGNSGIQASPYYVAITPNDGADLPIITRGIWVGGAGNLSVVCLNTGATVTFSGIPAGTLLPLQTARVRATNTTATLLVAMG